MCPTLFNSFFNSKMKKALLWMLCCATGLTSQAQETRDVMVVKMLDGMTHRFVVEDIDYIEFVEEDVPDPHQGINLGGTVLWAVCNVGAEQPEGLGDLFSWAETDPKSDYSEDNYLYYSNYTYQYVGNNISGVEKYDAATAQWGAPWRMPTLSEIRELMSCSWAPETLNGVKGYRVTATNGNSIFLPAAGYQPGTERLQEGEQGYYWSSSLNRDMPSSAFNINFRGYDAEWSASRAYGFSIRAVKDF